MAIQKCLKLLRADTQKQGKLCLILEAILGYIILNIKILDSIYEIAVSFTDFKKGFR